MILSMAGVWSTASGTKVEAQERVKVGGGVMPDGSCGIFRVVKAELGTAKVYDKDGKDTGNQDDVVKIQWKCVEGHTPDGDDIVNRVQFQTLRLWDEDDAKCDNARRMFASIDLLVNEGKLAEAEAEIDNETLADLVDGEAMLTVGMFKGRNGGQDGNYVSAIAPDEDYEPFQGEEDTTPTRTPRTTQQEEKTTERPQRTRRSR
jgi:hypothetical protein